MFELKKIYRPINGAEWKEIMLRRIQKVLESDNTVNVVRAFPLFRYKISIELHPYRPYGAGDPVPEGLTSYEVEGETFVPVIEQAVELVEESPIYGLNADPQDLRRDAGLGIIETARSTIGELVDVRVKPRLQEIVESTSEPGAAPDEDPRETYQIEQKRWSQARADLEVERAIETRDPSYAPGRVSVIRSVLEGGGSEHGRRR